MNFQKIKRFKYTIVLAAICCVAFGVIGGLAGANHNCSKKGGDFVMSFPIGYTCVGEHDEH